jgi:phosphoribosylformylglycinamidine synthase PurS subunit
MVIAEIRIELKPGVADPEGQNTRKTLELLGFKGVNGVRSIKVFEVDIDGPEDRAKADCEDMCRRLLANPVIQRFSVQIK